jgi:membrane protein implicated in regulation of membrane protease activity
MMTPGFFLLWFGIGALVAAILAYLRFSSVWQWLSFIGISSILLALSRRFAEKVSAKQPPGIGANRLIGKYGIVKEEINPDKGTGAVRVEKDDWKAETSCGEVIPSGEKVVVLKVEGTHVVVKKSKEEKI